MIKRTAIKSVLSVLLPLFVVAMMVAPVLAYIYYATFTVIETAGNDHEMLAVMEDSNNDWMADNGFMLPSAMDTRIETLGGLARPHMVTDNMTLAAIPVPPLSQTNLYFTTGATTNLTAMDIIFGYDGYATVSDNATLEPGTDFEIEFDAWVNTDNGSDKNLLYKEDVFRTYVSATENITSVIYSDNISPTGHVDPDNKWANETNAYDGNTVTYSEHVTIGAGAWGSFLELTHASLYASSVRVYISIDAPEALDLVDVDYYTTAWQHIYSGAFNDNTWNTYDIEDTITAVRIRLFNNNAGALSGYIHEVEFIGPPDVSVTATGVSSGEIVVLTKQVDNTAGGWLTGWDKRMAIDVDSTKIDANLTHFPLLITLSTTAGINNEDVTAIFDEVGANGLKIAVTQSDGTTEIYVEEEKWDSVGEEARLWTSSNTTVITSATDTRLYIYFDGDHADNTAYVGVSDNVVVEDVWDANFVLVDHMEDAATNAATYDSTSNNNDGVKKGANEPIEAAGKIAQCQDFDDLNDYITVADDPTFNLVNTMTITAFALNDNITGAEEMITSKYTSAGNLREWNIARMTATGRVRMYFGDPLDGTAEARVETNDAYFVDATWLHVGATYDTGTLLIFADGVSRAFAASSGAVPATLYNGTADVIHGADQAGTSNIWNGQLDEIRISNTKRNPEWIKAEYYTGVDNLIDFVPDADGDLDEFQYDLSISIDGTEEDRTPGIAVSDNVSDWYINQNNVMPYMNYYKHTVSSVLIAHYEPNTMIIGNTLPNREETIDDATIHWGLNTANVTATLGAMVAAAQPAPGVSVDAPTGDILPETGASDWFVEPDVSGTLLTNPLRPLVTILSDTTTLSESQAWIIYALALVLLVLVGTAVAVRGHLLISGIATGAAIYGMVALTIFPMWALVFVVGAVIGGVLAERMPSV